MPPHTVKPSRSKKRSKDGAEEEADLEAQLFGTRKSAKKPSKRSKREDDEEETGLGWMQDSDVRWSLRGVMLTVSCSRWTHRHSLCLRS